MDLIQCFIMGCSASVSLPDSFEKKPLPPFPQVIEDSTKLNNKSDVQLHSLEGQTNKNNNNNVYDKNNTNAQNQKNSRLVLSPTNEHLDLTADSECIVPIFNNNNNERRKSLYPPRITQYTYQCYDSRINTPLKQHRSQSLHSALKSALRSGRHPSHDHMIANQPIKTVTFMDTVTVVCVY